MLWAFYISGSLTWHWAATLKRHRGRFPQLYIKVFCIMKFFDISSVKWNDKEQLLVLELLLLHSVGEVISSRLLFPNVSKCSPWQSLKLHLSLTWRHSCCLCHYTTKILKRCIMYIYWAISHSNQETSHFQVSSTSEHEHDASVSWLWSNRWRLLSRQSSVVWQNHRFKSLLLQ